MKWGEVWWVNFDPARGTEINKMRPAVIVSNDSANRNMARVVVVPLTSNIKNVYICEAVVTVKGVENKAAADQIMTADKSRLSNKIGMLTEEDLGKVENIIRIHLQL